MYSICLFIYLSIKLACLPVPVDIESDFKDQLKDLVPYLLSQRHLVMKEISENRVVGQDLIEYFRVRSAYPL